jgi:hypothetical protein
VFLLGDILLENSQGSFDLCSVVSDPAERQLTLNVVNVSLVHYGLCLQDRPDFVHVELALNHQVLQECDAVGVGVVQIESLQHHSVVSGTEFTIVGNIGNIECRESKFVVHIVLGEVQI